MEPIKNNHNKFDYQKSLKKPTATFLISKIKFIDIYLNRPLASLIVRAVYKTRITPNHLTYGSFFLGLLAAFFFSRGEYVYFILGGVSAQLSSIVDGTDGMLARSKDMCSRYGAHLDLFLDRIIDFSMAVGIALGTNTYFNNPDLLFLGILAGGLYLLQVNLFYLTKDYLQVKETGETGEVRALVLLSMMILAIAGRLDIFIYLVLAETVIVNVVRLFYFVHLGEKKGS